MKRSLEHALMVVFLDFKATIVTSVNMDSMVLFVTNVAQKTAKIGVNVIQESAL